MVSEYYGLKLPITQFRDLIKVDNFGSNFYGIIEGAKEIGLKGLPLEGNTEELLDAIEKEEVTFPFIAQIINKEMFEHFVVVYSIRNEKVYIGDPAKQTIIKMPFELFVECWQQQILCFEVMENFEKKNERKGTLNKFFKLVFHQKKRLVLIFLVSLLVSLISISTSYFFQYIIDDAIQMGDINGEMIYEEDEDEHDHDHEEDYEESKVDVFLDKATHKINEIFSNLRTVCLSVVALFIIQALLQFLRSWLLALLCRNIDVPISTDYYDHLVDLPASFFGTRKTGELISRFSDVSNIRDAISAATLTIMLDTLMAIIAGVFLFSISSKLFLITAIILILYALIMIIYKKPIKIINQDIMEKNAQITAYLKETIDGIETIKAYQFERRAKHKTKHMYESFVKRIVNGTILFNSQEILVGCLESIGMVVLLWTGVYLCIDNVISIGALITFYYMLNYFLDPVKSLIDLQPEMQTAIVAAERLNDVLDVPIESTENREAEDLKGDIICKNICFRYGYRDLVLNDLSIKFNAGSKTAIIGESGSGKTTLAKLLMGFYTPECGSIDIGGQSLSDYSRSSIRSKISYISQDVFLLSDTIYNNLRFGNDGILEQQIIDICKQCGADSFIQKLPMGYDTMLEENGNNLSGGQKQRLAIARALLRKPDILIMDEATSNLDTVTEESIKTLIDNLSKDITCIIIAHRLSTIKSCDYIYVLDNGKVIEEGTHKHLMEINGRYRSFFDKS